MSSIGSNLPPLPPAPMAKPTASISQDDQRRLNNATADFEAMFIQQMFKAMRKSVPDDPKGGLFSKGNGGKMFEEMLDGEYAKNFSRSGSGLGLKEAIFKQTVSKQIAHGVDAQSVVNHAQKAENSLNAAAHSPIGKAGVVNTGSIPNASPQIHLPAAGNPPRVGPEGPVHGSDS
ncbi:MAG: rod-binding protein [Magnetococcales bacterium]|nr:rod-binding protein [Magnetococcales bacterium]